MAELNMSFVELLGFEDFVPELEEVSEGQRKWIDEAKRELKCEDEDDLTADLFARPNKSVMSRWLEGARDIMCRQQQMLENFKDLVSTMKTEAIGDKTKVIKLQGKLLDCKEEQLAAVKTTVQDTVQTEMRTYGDVLKSTSPAAISPATFKKVVKDVIKDEDRSKNLMVFGLTEEDGEQLNEKICDVFVEIGEKPQLVAVRIGRRQEGGTGCRPVKVTLTSSTAVQQILTRARLLKQQERLKDVYVSPDRSPEERSARRLLVEERKKRAEDEPGRNHFIKGGKVCSVEKT